jgi:hypothetical protein
VHLTPERAWLHWPAGSEEILQEVLAIQGVEVFARREGGWYRPGQHLPAFHVPPVGETRPLHQVLFPAPIQAEEVGQQISGLVSLTLVRDEKPRPATALLCSLEALNDWADRATTWQLEGLKAAQAPGDNGGRQVLVLGPHLPPLAEGERFWGKQVLIPLGYRPEPNLPEGVLHEALGLQAGELALLTSAGLEVAPRDALGKVTRAGIRLAWREHAQ